MQGSQAEGRQPGRYTGQSLAGTWGHSTMGQQSWGPRDPEKPPYPRAGHGRGKASRMTGEGLGRPKPKTHGMGSPQEYLPSPQTPEICSFVYCPSHTHAAGATEKTFPDTLDLYQLLLGPRSRVLGWQ